MAETSEAADPQEPHHQSQPYDSSSSGGGGGAISTADYLTRTISDSKDFVLRSAPSIGEGLSNPLRRSRELLPELKAQYTVYEDAFFGKLKEGLLTAREHPTLAGGVAFAAGVLLMKGPRRFLFRNTLGRLRGEEALLGKAEKGLMNLDQAVQLTRNESKKLIERAGYAESAMLGAQTRLKGSTTQIKKLVADLRKRESKVADFIDELRELPGRDALKLRAEVASMMAEMREHRSQLEKRISRVSELGISV